MSKTSAAKKARRKRRLDARNQRWLPADVHADVAGVTRIADEIGSRGWQFDTELSTGEFVSWFFPPSGVEDPDAVDESVELVTRIWLSDPAEPHVILVGSDDEDGVDQLFTVEELFARLDAIEAYRMGDPQPSFD